MLRRTKLLPRFSHLKKKKVLSVMDKFINICEVLGIIIMISDLEKTEEN